MEKGSYRGAKSRGKERRFAIEESLEDPIEKSLEDPEESIRKTGKEIIKEYFDAVSKISGWGRHGSTNVEQAFSFISEKLHQFPADEQEKILGEVIANISTAIKSAYPHSIEWNPQKTRWWIKEGNDEIQEIYAYLEKQLEKGDISSAGAVFRSAFYRSESSQQKQHVIDFLSAIRLGEDGNEYFTFAEKAKDEIKDEIGKHLLEQREYALLVTNNYLFNLSLKQWKKCIAELLSSRESKTIQEGARFVHCDSTSPLAHAIKDAWISQMSPSEYKTFFMDYIWQQAVINPLFIDDNLLLQCNFESEEPSHYTALSNCLRLPEMSNEAVLHIGTQMYKLEGLQDSVFYTPERIRAFSETHARNRVNFDEIFPQDPTGAKGTALQFPWLMKSVDDWAMDVTKMTPERQKELVEQLHTLPKEQHAEFTQEFAQQGIIGSRKEREATLAAMLKNAPPDRHEAVKKSFYEKGITNGQMERWLGYHAFKVPEGWDPKIVGKIMFSRLQNGVSDNMHNASYFLSDFVTPKELQHDDEETKRRKKSYDATAQKWLINYVATPAETLILAWQNRDAALADGCADNPGALVQWTKANAVRLLFKECGQSFDISNEIDQYTLAFLTETVRCASPKKTLEIWGTIQASHNTESFLRPVKIDLGNGYSGEIFRKDDPRGTTIGADTGCCMSVGGASENCIIAGYTDPRYGFFALYHEGKLAAQSLIYINPEASSDTLVCDNIEACAGRNPSKVTEYYQKFFAAYAPKNATIISKVYVGMGHTDAGNTLPLVPHSDMIFTVLPIYTDAGKTQRLLLDTKTVQAAENNLVIQWQDEKPCVQFTDTPANVEWDEDDEDDDEDEDGDEE